MPVKLLQKNKKNNASKEKRTCTETLTKQLASKLIMNRRVYY